MLKNKNLIISVCSLLLILTIGFGCGYRQVNIQKDDVAYLKFNKSMFKKYSVTVNEKYKFSLNACVKDDRNCSDPSKNKLFEVKSGNNFIEVTDSDGKLVFRKTFYVGSFNTKEINLP